MNKLLLATAAAAILAAGPASAITVEINNVVASWTDGVLDNGSDPTYVGNGTGSPQVRWGGGSPDSAYDFDSVGDLSLEVTPPADSEDFVIGTFTHENNPINRPFLTSVTLAITGDILIDGNLVATPTLMFDFTHVETINDDEPCEFGGANGQGVNTAGCADRVSFVFNPASEDFVIDGNTYTLTLSGFRETEDGPIVPFFLTRENQDNTALLTGRLTLRANLVPAPATLALFGLGIAGVALSRRRAK